MLLVKVEALVNSKPMTTEIISGVKSHILLLPANLLDMKSKVILPLPQCFSSTDVYCWKFGEEFSILQMNFDVGGAKIFYKLFKNKNMQI